MWPRLQRLVAEAATLWGGGCNPMWRRPQAEMRGATIACSQSCNC